MDSWRSFVGVRQADLLHIRWRHEDFRQNGSAGGGAFAPPAFFHCIGRNRCALACFLGINKNQSVARILGRRRLGFLVDGIEFPYQKANETK